MNTAVRVTSQQIRRADDTVGGWLLGLIDGKGNSPSQIIVTAVLGCVPVVGQLFDLRDLIRCIIALTVPGAGVWAWVDLVITIVGCIPGFGDAFKAGVKLAKAGAKADRVFDAMRTYGRMDPERALRQMDWAKVQREAVQMLGKMIDGIIDALDGWLVQLVAGRQQVRELVAALKQIKQTAPTMIGKAINEIKHIVNSMLGKPRVVSTAQVSTAKRRLSSAAGTAGKAKPKPKDASGQNVARRGTPNAAAVRQSKKKRWHSGVPAQHIVDYHVKAGRKPLRKVNDHGRLVEEWDRLKKLDDVVVRESVINVPGLDHLWFGPYRGRKYTVGETKGSVWAQFSFMAGMAQKDKDAVVDTRNDTAAVMDAKRDYDPNAALRKGKAANASVSVTNEAALSDPSKRTGTLSATKTKGRQMSHLWVRASIDADSTILGGHKQNLQRQIELARRTGSVPTAYHREVFMVTGKQYEQHDRTKGREHHIQPPVIQIPDNILLK
jgi:hypothetical protein